LNLKKRDAIDIVDLIIGGANLVASGAGVYLQDQTNFARKRCYKNKWKKQQTN